MDTFRGVRFVDRGHLPRVGGWTDQSATFIDAMSQIEADERKMAEDRRSHPFHRNE